MTDELSIEGKQYISSKRASDLSGYAQDYVGQLARKGFIDAQRIGGLWYVYVDSLLKYKEKSEEYVPKPPQATFRNDAADTLVSFDGKDFVSAARGADITGYHQDYIGQLARGEKISSRQVGNRWYVDRESLLKHKEEKDALLGAVQAQSVGIKVPAQDLSPYRRKVEEWEPLSYQSDAAALIPELVNRERSFFEEEEYQEEVVPVPIRVLADRQVPRPLSKYLEVKGTSKKVKISGKTIFYVILITITVTLITILFYAAFLNKSIKSEFVQEKSPPGLSFALGGLTSTVTSIGDFIEPLLTKELNYTRE